MLDRRRARPSPWETVGPSMGYWEKLDGQSRDGMHARGAVITALRERATAFSGLVEAAATDGSRPDPCRATAAGNRLALRNVT